MLEIETWAEKKSNKCPLDIKYFHFPSGLIKISFEKIGIRHFY